MTQTPQNGEIVPEQEATTLSFDEILKQDDECMAYLKIGNMKQAISQAYQRGREEASKVTGETSDGYHTFNELYEFRKLFNAALFNDWAMGGWYSVHKSKKHHDGEECFGGGWFIVMATLPTGQISNHYELKDWDLFQCEERENAVEWDGHTAQDVLKRLNGFVGQTRPRAMD